MIEKVIRLNRRREKTPTGDNKLVYLWSSLAAGAKTTMSILKSGLCENSPTVL